MAAVCIEDKTKTLEERFWSMVNKDGPMCERLGSKCWLWAGAKSKGYGHIYIGGRVVLAPRVSYILENGNIPDETFILHGCDNPPCINPDHLEVGSQHKNMQDWQDRHPHPMPKNCTRKGLHLSDETKTKLSILAKGNKWCIGRPLSKNTRRDEFGRFTKHEN